MHKLEIDNILLEFGSRTILSDVYLKCETGKITGLLGRNGIGKSSLMSILFGSLNPKSKSIRLDGNHITKTFQDQNKLLYLPQFNFIPKKLSLKRIFADYNLDYSLFEAIFVEFKSKYQFRIENLSGGQRRVVEVYIVLKSKSDFSMLDEPFSHLSPIMIEIVKDIIVEEKKNKGILITDHMYKHIIDISDDIYLLADRKVHAIKDLKEIEWLGYARV